MQSVYAKIFIFIFVRLTYHNGVRKRHKYNLLIYEIEIAYVLINSHMGTFLTICPSLIDDNCASNHNMIYVF